MYFSDLVKGVPLLTKQKRLSGPEQNLEWAWDELGGHIGDGREGVLEHKSLDFVLELLPTAGVNGHSPAQTAAEHVDRDLSVLGPLDSTSHNSLAVYLDALL